MKNIEFVAAILTGALAVSCHSKPQQFNSVQNSAEVQHSYATVQQGAVNSDVQIPGELISFQQVDIYAKITSFVKKLYVDLGTQIHKGQVLAVLEAPEMESQLAAAKQRYNAQQAVVSASESTYQRLLETSKTPGTVSPNDLSIALSKWEADRAQLSSAKAVYQEIIQTQGYLTIRAPFSGIISARNVALGAYVGPNGKGSAAPLFTLQQQNHMRLTVTVPEVYSNYLKPGNAVKFSVAAYPGREFTAKVNRLAGALDPVLRTQKVEIDVFDDTHTLLPGMAAQVHLHIGGQVHVLHVPSSALLQTTTVGAVVIKNENNKAKWITVQKGREVDGQTEIFGNLQAGDQVVSAPSEEIRDGQAL